MDVAGLDPDPIHRAQMADRVALVAVQHELRLRGRAGGEVEQQRVGGARLALRVEARRLRLALAEVAPAGRSPHGDAHVIALELLEPRRQLGRRDHRAHPPARDAVGQVRLGQHGRRRDHDGPELHRGEHRLP